MLRQAMLFAAGLGTRLRPLTDDRPKALVEIAGQPLLGHVLDRLAAAGWQRVVVNVHHFADQVIAYLRERPSGRMDIRISDERDLLLDTGGGLAFARKVLDAGPVLIHNVDIVSTIDLNKLWQTHLDTGATATLAVRDRATSRQLLFDDTGLLSGWRNNRTGETIDCRPTPSTLPLAFSGVYVVSPQLYDYFPTDRRVFSIIDVLLQAGATEPVLAYRHDADHWFDVGKPATLAQATHFLTEKSSD